MTGARRPMPVGTAPTQLPGHRPGAAENPIDTYLTIARANAAKAWRRDFTAHPARESMWRMFKVGMLLGSRPGVERNSLTQAAHAAEREVPWTGVVPVPCDVLVDVRRPCGHPAPCPDHPDTPPAH